MKHAWWVALLAGGFYAYHVGYFDTLLQHSATTAGAPTRGGRPAIVAEVESAPQQMIDMQQAIGDSGSGSQARGHVDAARRAAGGGSPE